MSKLASCKPWKVLSKRSQRVIGTVIILISVIITALSLMYEEEMFCTSFERGWPFSVIIYPCLCYGYGEVDWIINWWGTLLNIIIYALSAVAGYGIIYRLRKLLTNK